MFEIIIKFHYYVMFFIRTSNPMYTTIREIFNYYRGASEFISRQKISDTWQWAYNRNAEASLLSIRVLFFVNSPVCSCLRICICVHECIEKNLQNKCLFVHCMLQYQISTNFFSRYCFISWFAFRNANSYTFCPSSTD